MIRVTLRHWYAEDGNAGLRIPNDSKVAQRSWRSEEPECVGYLVPLCLDVSSL